MVVARIPLYYVEHEFEKENRARTNENRSAFRVVLLSQGDQPPIGVSLPDVPMPWLREFKVDNAFEPELSPAFRRPLHQTIGKRIGFLIGEHGAVFFNNSGDLATETRYYDKLANSLVLPVLGNLSFKPEIDPIYYRGKVGPLTKRLTFTRVRLTGPGDGVPDLLPNGN